MGSVKAMQEQTKYRPKRMWKVKSFVLVSFFLELTDTHQR